LTVLDVIRDRRSIRKYEDRKIPKNLLDQVLEAARLAQSAGNKQPWEFVLVSEKTLKNKLAASFVGESAVVIVCIAHPENCGHVGFSDSFLVDVAIAIENMALVSWELGLGSCWIGHYDEEKVKNLLNIPKNLKVVSLLSLGFPKEKINKKMIKNNKKSLSQIIHFEKYKK
jgi:nitroreductase